MLCQRLDTFCIKRIRRPLLAVRSLKLEVVSDTHELNSIILFRYKYSKHFWKSESSVLLLHFLLEEFHGIGLGLLGNDDVGFHGLVVGVAGPLHHNLRRDATGERKNLESNFYLQFRK